MFAQIYECSEHGQIWQGVYTAEIIDIVNDDVYHIPSCSLCNRSVRPVMHEGAPVVHVLTPEEARAEMDCWYDDEEDFEEEDEYYYD